MGHFRTALCQSIRKVLWISSGNLPNKVKERRHMSGVLEVYRENMLQVATVNLHTNFLVERAKVMINISQHNENSSFSHQSVFTNFCHCRTLKHTFHLKPEGFGVSF